MRKIQESNLITNNRKQPQILVGNVIQDKLEKTITVKVVRKYQHPTYHKVISSFKKYLVNDPHNKAKINDRVSIIAGRKLSARKRFRLFKILHSFSVTNQQKENGTTRNKT